MRHVLKRAGIDCSGQYRYNFCKRQVRLQETRNAPSGHAELGPAAAQNGSRKGHKLVTIGIQAAVAARVKAELEVAVPQPTLHALLNKAVLLELAYRWGD